MTRPFIHDDFLLQSDTARELYERYARDLPIVDFHCHLSPEQMASDHRFRSLTEIWLEGDHYKWRAMRACGVPERCCSGEASDWEKFEAWARTVPETLRNPLFHWTAMELKRPFGIDTLLSPSTAREIFEAGNARLREDGFTAMGLLRSWKVGVVCSTDDPVDSLEPHRQLARRADPATRVYPTWRPDAGLTFDDPKAWNAWVGRLEAAAGRTVRSFGDLMEALDARHQAFHELGCRASDHGLETLPPPAAYADADVATSFDALRAGRALERGPALALQAALLHRMGAMDHERGWVQQFHLGAFRNVSSRLYQRLGANVGGDSMGDFEMARGLAAFLDGLDRRGKLAKTILYNLNPRDNELFATMAGNFNDGTVPGKMQYGASWWFLDQKDGIEAQFQALSNMGLLSRFVGMITDSRSFLSYSRHDYFRRILCNVLGEDVRQGLVPDDGEALGRLVTNVCFTNARDFFGFELGSAAGAHAR
ncbi:MAG TPA: glucuronate isomerase [Vicinamibacteria bacterium]|nr:glucuronate isomerase [Vicinamibacteria bacterium]